jgi:hypothetical protein
MAQFSTVKKIIPGRAVLSKGLTCILVALSALLQHGSVKAGNTSYIVHRTTNIVDGTISPYNNLKPGDTLKLAAGSRDYLLVRNLSGAPGNPVIITNSGGTVVIDTDHYFGISVLNSTHFRLTGQGDPDHFYGIRIERVALGAGIGVGNLSSDFEIDHVYITHCAIGGIYAKTDPDCSFTATRDKFIQKNTVIRHNYIGNVGDEGLYIGSTQYFGQTVRCAGRDTLLMPSLLDGVQVYGNIIENSGWDGIQVSAAISNCNIYDNIIRFDSRKEQPGQMSGILLGGGSKCDCFNNLIRDGKGNGIENHGLGGNRIFNNIIINPGLTFRPADVSQMKYGIFVTDVSTEKDSSYYILFNHILHPKSDGIRFQSTISRNNLIASNLIVNPGNFDYYESGNFSFKGKDAYVMLPNPLSEVNMQNNFFTRSTHEAGISQDDHTPMAGSPLIDAGFHNTQGIDFDFNYEPRPLGITFDIGAFESRVQTSSIARPEVTFDLSVIAYLNPADQNLTLNWHDDRADQATVTLYNLQGKPMTIMHLNYIKPGRQTILIETGRLVKGIYIYTIKADNIIYNGKFLKNH